ncbi:nuclear transport factor 2 family protein [Bizionia echini]|uniref:nuclear transport factor 2 family protein n=1 Tax=Bizionia echini TaxID=649333 RepID=UPI0030DDA915|tara:strand:- start:276 stop:737 length:462 start_codon:yes stop_codon:yes gene_type:complete
MTKKITYLAILMVSLTYAQNNSEIAVKEAIDTFFEGFHKGDTVLMKTVMYGKFPSQTTFKDNNGNDQIHKGNISDLLVTLASKKPDQKWQEKLLDYHIQVDGNLAHAWTPYEFWFNDQFSHCGVNSFQLFNDNGQWKIIYLVDSRRTEDCKPK